MAYIIYNSDGTQFTIPDNLINDTFYNPTGGTAGNGLGMQLIGQNTIEYGAAIAQNFVQLMSNFSSATGALPADANSLQGQLWFNNTSKSLYVRSQPSFQSGGLSNWSKVGLLDSNGNFDGNAETATSLTGGNANFIPYQTAPNTTAMLPIGLNGQVLTAGSPIAWSSNPPLDGSNFTSVLGCVSQTWKNLTMSRVAGTTYTNTGTAPISVSVTGNGGTSGSVGLSLTVNGIIISNAYVASSNGIQTVSGIVPPGNTYTITLAGATTISVWAELS